MGKQSDKKAKARSLYLTGQYAQKEIAELVDVTEKTISKWKEEEGWEEMKTSLLTTRENELRRLYKILKNVNDSIDLTVAAGLPVGAKEADSVLKFTAAIRNLEIETSIAEKVEVGMAFIDAVRKEDPELAKVITKHFDNFLQSSLK